MLRFIQQSWFLIVLVSALILGYLLAESCRPLAEAGWLKWAVVAFTMFVMALPVSFANLRKAALDFRAPALAIGLNSILIPLLAWPLSFLLGPDLGFGLVVASAAPCTLASAAVWTRRAGGNDSIAILVTIVTNTLCFVVTPFWVFTLLGEAVGSLEQVNYSSTLWKLLLLVVAPMGLGQVLRVSNPVAQWATSQKRMLGVVAQVGILIVVLIGSVATALRMKDSMGGSDSGEIVLAIGVVSAIHLLVLAVGIGIARWMKFGREEQIAVGFGGSQKTLMVGLSTAMELGVSIIPIVAYHSVQLILDTVIADRWKAATDFEKDASLD
jgi:sodium/bile acid cotransporter 7